MKVRRKKKMTIVTRKIVRGGVALFVALGIITFGINSFQPVHAMAVGGNTGGSGGSGGSGSGSGGSTTTTPAAPAAPYATNVTVTVSGVGASGNGGGGICYAQSTGNLQQEVNCVGMSSSDPGNYWSYPSGFKVSVTYKVQFADATPNAIVYCYVYVHGNPTVYSTGSNLSLSYTTDGSSVYGFCYAQVGNGPQSAQISLP